MGRIPETIIADILSHDLDSVSKVQLVECIKELTQFTAFKREDRLKLQILEDMCFTIWACNRDCDIVLWEGACKEIYKKSKDDVIAKNYLETIVKPIEQEQSKEDCLKIIDTGRPQSFRLCYDQDSRGHSVEIISQCCRIYDDDGAPLQAEMAIHIDYEQLVKENQEFEENEKKKNIAIEVKKDELQSACLACYSRLNETFESRMYYFSNQRDKAGCLYASSLTAKRKLVQIRSEYSSYYQEIKRQITESFREKYPCADKFLAQFQNKEIDFDYQIAEVSLSEE